MDNRPAFAEDLMSLKDEIAGEVAADVSKVIQVVSGQRSKATAPKLEQPVRQPSSERSKVTRPREASENPVIVNFTTRLARETLDQLGEAALRQQLKKLGPATRQAIVQEAVTDWLKRHGYSRSRGSEKAVDEQAD